MQAFPVWEGSYLTQGHLMILNKAHIMPGGQFLRYPFCNGPTPASDWLSCLVGERDPMSFRPVGEMIQ